MDVVLIIFAFVVVFWIYVLLPMGMAGRLGRSRFGWLLVSLIFSPLAAVILLLLLGKAQA